AFAAANPQRPPSRTTGSWSNLCGVLINQFGLTLPWRSAPGVVGPTAKAVMNASGARNPHAAAAPVGAFHWFSWGNSGHVGIDLSGGGHDVFMASAYLRESWGKGGIGVNSASAWGARSDASYLGWTTQYGGGILTIPAEPTPAPTAPASTSVSIGI